MNVYTSVDQLPAGLPSTVVTIGNFDGVHRGHQRIIADVIQEAKKRNSLSVALTFHPHPARILRPEMAPRLITPDPCRLELLAATGINAILVLPFTRELSQMSAREFATEILGNRLHAVSVHEGDNFRFGHAASGDVEGLTALGRELGFSVHAHHPEQVRNRIISSSCIRGTLAAGDLSLARAMLGRAFFVDSTPAAGRGYGSRYTVPTINLAPYSELLPAIGVYATCMQVGDRKFHAVTNVGNRPTFGSDSFAVESHLLDFEPLPLDERTPLRLTFLSRLRGEVRWPSPEALKQQIAKDVARARRIHRAIGRQALQTSEAASQPS